VNHADRPFSRAGFVSSFPHEIAGRRCVLVPACKFGIFYPFCLVLGSFRHFVYCGSPSRDKAIPFIRSIRSRLRILPILWLASFRRFRCPGCDVAPRLGFVRALSKTGVVHVGFRNLKSWNRRSPCCPLPHIRPTAHRPISPRSAGAQYPPE
jgi:hypothetical protein